MADWKILCYQCKKFFNNYAGNQGRCKTCVKEYPQNNKGLK